MEGREDDVKDKNRNENVAQHWGNIRDGNREGVGRVGSGDGNANEECPMEQDLFDITNRGWRPKCERKRKER